MVPDDTGFIRKRLALFVCHTDPGISNVPCDQMLAIDDYLRTFDRIWDVHVTYTRRIRMVMWISRVHGAVRYVR